MDESNFRKIRLEKLEKIKALGWNPYASSFDKKQTIEQALKSLNKTVKTAGKIFSFREHGNIAFADLKDESGKIQLFFQKKYLSENYKNLKLLDIGDYIGVEGEVVKTTAGEISIAPTSYTLLTKSLLPLPSEFFGIKDVETRYRQRYLDLLLNPDVREKFNKRTKMVSAIREYLDNLGFWEIESPTFQPLYGGANAKPFKTHVKALNRDMYLRIADELYLKRLIIGGYERAYEICKDFRNEGIDASHSPEFTMIEWYEAYADYQRVMDVAEGLFKHIAEKLYGHTALLVDKKKIDIGKKWPRIEISVILKEKLGLNVEKETVESLLSYIKKNCAGMEIVGGETKGQLIFAIFENKIPKLLEEPTWIIDYPEDVSPLSKPHRNKPGWVERFEGYIGGKEICDGWSELTDPKIQRERFMQDTKISRKDKEEVQPLDEDFLTAMEYGMPPLGGIGIGIDRLAEFFTDTWVIKDVILFPMVRSMESSVKVKQDFAKKIIIVVDKDLEDWQAMNALAHVTAYIGNKIKDQFATGENFVSKDNAVFPRNSQYPIIVLSGESQEIHRLVKKVKVSGLLYHVFIREMIETTDDEKIVKILSEKKEDEIEYLGIGVFGPNEEVSKFTKNFDLWKSSKKQINNKNHASQKVSMTRKDAYALLTKHISLKNLIKHCLACEEVMKGIYKHLHSNDFSAEGEKQWGITGLLHDIDYELAQKENKLNKHGVLFFEKYPNIIPEPIAHAIKSHNFQNTNIDPVTNMDWAITCCDQLTGIIVASALIHKDKKLGYIDADFVLKRFNTPSFAKGASRETIKLCEEKLGIPLRQFVEITLKSMQEISKELGL